MYHFVKKDQFHLYHNKSSKTVELFPSNEAWNRKEVSFLTFAEGIRYEQTLYLTFKSLLASNYRCAAKLNSNIFKHVSRNLESGKRWYQEIQGGSKVMNQVQEKKYETRVSLQKLKVTASRGIAAWGLCSTCFRCS